MFAIRRGLVAIDVVLPAVGRALSTVCLFREAEQAAPWHPCCVPALPGRAAAASQRSERRRLIDQSSSLCPLAKECGGAGVARSDECLCGLWNFEVPGRLGHGYFGGA